MDLGGQHLAPFLSWLSGSKLAHLLGLSILRTRINLYSMQLGSFQGVKRSLEGEESSLDISLLPILQDFLSPQLLERTPLYPILYIAVNYLQLWIWRVARALFLFNRCLCWKISTHSRNPVLLFNWLPTRLWYVSYLTQTINQAYAPQKKAKEKETLRPTVHGDPVHPSVFQLTW